MPAAPDQALSSRYRHAVDDAHAGEPILVEPIAEVVGEIVKAVAVYNGVDPITAAGVGGTAAGTIKGLDVALRNYFARRRARLKIAVEEAT